MSDKKTTSLGQQIKNEYLRNFSLSPGAKRHSRLRGNDINSNIIGSSNMPGVIEKIQYLLVNLLFLLLFITSVVGGVFYFHLTQKHYTEAQHKQINKAFKVVTGTFTSLTTNLQKQISLLSQNQQLYDVFRNQAEDTQTAVNNILDLYKHTLNLKVCYLLDANGTTVASSNRSSTTSFVGKNYSFRPYFQAALKGHPQLYAAVGVTSNERGLYLSHPIYDKIQRQVQGVIVFKLPVVDIEKKLSIVNKFTTAVVSPGGIIFLSNRPELTLQWLWEPTLKDREAQRQSKQFGISGLIWSGLQRIDKKLVVTNSKEHLTFHEKELKSLPGWRIYLFHKKNNDSLWISFYRTSQGQVIAFIIVFIVCLSTLLRSLVIRNLKYRISNANEAHKLTQALEQSPLSVVITDTNGNITYVNHTFEILTGYSRAEAIGENPKILKVDGVQSNSFYRDLWLTITAGKTWQGEFCNCKKNGDIFWESATIAPIFGSWGNIKSYFSIKEDITERRLQNFEMQRLKDILDRIVEAVFVIEPQNLLVLYANLAGKDLLGRYDREVVGEKIAAILPEMPSGYFERTFESLSEQSEHQIIFETLLQSELPIWVEIQLQYISITEENNAFVMIIRDISERKQFMEELSTAKNEAETANRYKTEFLANMSHEIRTPLNGVIGMTELLSLTSMTEEQQQYVAALQKSSANLLALINNILDLTKIERNHMELLTNTFSLHGLVDNLRESLMVLAAKKNLFLKTEITPEVPDIVAGDENKLKQVLTNLLGNSIKFTTTGGVTLTLKKTPINPKNEDTKTPSAYNVRFIVRDTGVGIAPENQEVIFKQFRQLNGSLNRLHGGTGLGLNLVQTIVNLMGGKVAVKSNLGEGSEFFFDIPFAHVVKRQEVESRQFDSPLHYDLQILVVDDNKLNLQLAQATLEKLGCKVVCANNGKRALEILENEKFSLIFMDIQMPDMDGLAVTKAIRESGDSYAGVPIVAMTAHAFSEDRDRFLNAGIDGYLPKPYTIADLKSELYNFTQRLEQKRASQKEENHISGEYIDSMSQQKVLDYEFTLQLIGGDWELLSSLYESALELLPEYIEELLHDLEINDLDKIKMSAHKLKGTSASIGALQLRNFCLRIETLIENERLNFNKEVVVLQQLSAATITSMKNFGSVEKERPVV